MTEVRSTGQPDKFQPLRDAYAAALPGRIARICDAWTRLDGVGAEAVDWPELQRLVHTISGSAGTFGFHAVSDQARELEDFMSRLDQYPRDEHKAEIERRLAALRLLAEQP